MLDELTQQARDNHRAYREKFQADLEPEHNGKTALMHDGEVMLILNDREDAYTVGVDQYGLGKFSLVRVGAPPLDVGNLAGMMA